MQKACLLLLSRVGGTCSEVYIFKHVLLSVSILHYNQLCRCFSTVHTITRKPVSWHQNLEEPADARFLNLIHQAAQGPRKRYPDTQTESPEIGRDSERRLNRVRVHSDIAPHKAKAWSWREDDHCLAYFSNSHKKYHHE
uniref:Uncharacterized protein n=1 Tax=Canis lupus dingo TaxID=286419 RepID=A0A8C0QWP2_CANLU